jgi:YD repeat-containing protein
MRPFVSSLVVSSALLAGSAAASSAPIDKTPSVTGTVARVTASQRLIEVTLADGTVQRFQWNSETKISGTLTPGAAVTVRYTPGTDGNNLALQITVSRN